MKTYSSIFLALAFFGLSSCVEDQDFDQWDDLEAIPTVDASLIYVESPESVINDAPAMGFYTQDFIFDAFNEAFIQDRVVEVIMLYEVDNSTSKPLDFTIEFLDAGNNVLDGENFNIPAAPTPTITREVLYGPGGRPLDILINTVTIRLTAINLGDNTSVSSLPDPKFIMRSGARARIRLK